MLFVDPGVPGAPPPGGQPFMRLPGARPRYPPRMELTPQQAAMYRARNQAPPSAHGLPPGTQYSGRYPHPQQMVGHRYDTKSLNYKLISSTTISHAVSWRGTN